MGEKLTEAPLTDVTGVGDLIDISTDLGGGNYQSRATKFPYTKDAASNITMLGEVNIDVINEKTLLNGVKIQGTRSERNGATSSSLMTGDVNTDNTNNSSYHLQGRNNVWLFLESDTNDTTPNDNPNIYSSVKNLRSAYKQCIDPSGLNICLIAGTDGTLASPAYNIKLGATYANPGTGNLPSLPSSTPSDFVVSVTGGKFGNSIAPSDRTVSVQSKQNATFFIEANTDNTAPTESASLVMSQSGNRTAPKIRTVVSGDFSIEHGGVAGNNFDIVFSTGGSYASAPAAGTIPAYTTPASEAMRISGSDQTVGFATGITLSTASILSHYEELIHVSDFVNDTLTLSNVNIRMSRTGNGVSLHFISMVGAAPAVPGASFESSTVLPVAFRPLVDQAVMFSAVVNNSVGELGVAVIRTNGTIGIYRNANFTTAFTTGTIGFQSFCGSYTI